MTERVCDRCGHVVTGHRRVRPPWLQPWWNDRWFWRGYVLGCVAAAVGIVLAVYLL